MTELSIPQDKWPHYSFFYNSVCPGSGTLDENVCFSLGKILGRHQLQTISTLSWPLKASGATAAVTAHLEPLYVNIARPPFVQDIHRNVESTTYVPLPLHVTAMFEKMMQEGADVKQDGGKHIAANLNPLVHDPFHLVTLNPGCLNSMITLRNHSRENAAVPDTKTPFNKMTTSINRFLRLGGAEAREKDYFHSFLEPEDSASSSHSGRPAARKSHSAHALHIGLIDFDRKAYFAQLRSHSTAKLAVSANVNIVNVIAIDEAHDYASVITSQSTAPLFPPAQPATLPASASVSSCQSTQSHVPSYKRTVLKPMLRFQLDSRLIVTSMITLSEQKFVVLGLNCGSIAIFNLNTLTYRLFDDLGMLNCSHGQPYLSSSNSVTSLCAISHPDHELLIVAGFATGEVVILDPFAPPSSAEEPYSKVVVGQDRFATYFRQFDLSCLARKGTQKATSYLLGHFKVSHKPITCITSTLLAEGQSNNSHNPMIIALGSEDGLVRFVDLIATHDLNYGDPSNFYNVSVITDIVSNYFQDGVRDIDFSPDFRFFVLCGRSDNLEVFRMSYFDVNGLLHKKSQPVQRSGRSRSGTVNSSSSSNVPPSSTFLSPPGVTPSTSFDISREVPTGTYYPPIIKDIAIVSRLKGHQNTAQKVKFVKREQYFSVSDQKFSGNYNLISCGSDGQINIWEFNTKALPKIKKAHAAANYRRGSVAHDTSSPSLPNRGKNTQLPSAKTHARSRSNAHEDLFHTHNLGINSLLNVSQTQTPPENPGEQSKIVFSLYRSLMEMRARKHYARHKKDYKTHLSCVVHAIVNDKELPSIQVPLSVMDLSCLSKHGNINGFTCSPTDFWVYTKGGDIFRFKISG